MASFCQWQAPSKCLINLPDYTSDGYLNIFAKAMLYLIPLGA